MSGTGIGTPAVGEPTYTYTGDLLTDLDRVRFNIGDTVEDAGPKPEDGNFTDAEINGLVTIEGSWQRAVAAAFETLASLWARHTNFTAEGMSASQSDIAKQYAASAIEWRNRYGFSGTGGAGSIAVIRADGYSDDLDNITVEGRA